MSLRHVDRPGREVDFLSGDRVLEHGGVILPQLDDDPGCWTWKRCTSGAMITAIAPGQLPIRTLPCKGVVTGSTASTPLRSSRCTLRANGR